eukprot:203247-Pleurochrysis_carterae.AAC.1
MNDRLYHFRTPGRSYSYTKGRIRVLQQYYCILFSSNFIAFIQFVASHENTGRLQSLLPASCRDMASYSIG